MSIQTYQELKDSLMAWLYTATTDFTARNTTLIDDLITIGESRIFRETRSKGMEEELDMAIAAGVIVIPIDYIGLKFAYIDGSPGQVLERRSAEWIYANYPMRSASGKPKYIARDRTNFIFGPYADSGYTVKGVYYKQMVLSDSAHEFFLNNPDLYLFACLAESELILGRDERVQLWEAKYQKILGDVNGFSKAEDVSGSTLRMRVG
jgi:hypothetical protein